VQGLRFLKDLRIVSDCGGIKVFRTTLPPIGVNTYFLTDGSTLVIIDPGYGAFDLAQKEFPDYLETLNVLITHAHYDHVSGLSEFPRKRIYISEAAEPGLYFPEKNLSDQFSKNGFRLSREAETVVLLTEGPAEIFSLRFHTWVLPGHTPGDALFDFGCCLFCGDILFEYAIGRTDFPGSSERLMKQSLKKLYALLKEQNPEKLIFPGHMNAFTVRHALEHNPFLTVYTNLSV